MSGKRAKALRRAFVAQHGRAPEPAQLSKGPAMGPIFPGKAKPWADVVKAAPSTIRKGKVVEMFVRRIFGVAVLRPSEWRRLKKSQQPKRSL